MIFFSKKFFSHPRYYSLSPPAILTNINFLLTISLHDQEKRFQEVIKWSPKGNALIFHQRNSFMETQSERLCVKGPAIKRELTVFSNWDRSLSTIICLPVKVAKGFCMLHTTVYEDLLIKTHVYLLINWGLISSIFNFPVMIWYRAPLLAAPLSRMAQLMSFCIEISAVRALIT